MIYSTKPSALYHPVLLSLLYFGYFGCLTYCIYTINTNHIMIFDNFLARYGFLAMTFSVTVLVKDIERDLHTTRNRNSHIDMHTHAGSSLHDP